MTVMNAIIYCRECNKRRMYVWKFIGLDSKKKRQYAYVCLSCRHRYVMYDGTNGEV